MFLGRRGGGGGGGGEGCMHAFIKNHLTVRVRWQLQWIFYAQNLKNSFNAAVTWLLHKYEPMESLEYLKNGDRNIL